MSQNAGLKRLILLIQEKKKLPNVELATYEQHRVHNYNNTVPFWSHRRTCTMFYVLFRTRKARQLCAWADPHHDGPQFNPSPTSDNNPLAPVATSHPWDSRCVAAQADLADEASAGTVFGVGANCQNSNFAGTPPEPSFFRPVAVVGRPPPGHS